jgi:hypothetical protein
LMTDGDPDSAIAAALEFEEKPSLDEMIAQVGDDLWTVYGGQRARLIGGMIQQPMREQVRRIAIYTALRAFLERIKYQPADVAKRLMKKGSANAEA